MTWTRISDDFYDDDAINELSDAAFRLHVYALVWSNKQLTDGLISKTRVRRLIPDGDIDKSLTELILTGLWADLGDDQFQIDWSQQEAAEDVRDRQEANARRNREYRKRKAAHADGDHSLCDPRHCPALRKPKRDAARDASRDNPRPVPSQREGQGTTAVCPHGHPPVDDTKYCYLGHPMEVAA